MADVDMFFRDAPCIDAALVARAGRSVARLKARGLSVVTAESCTAGLIAAVLAQAEGAGEVLSGSFVAYSKDHKAQALGVDRELLAHTGAVNATTAAQMLRGAMAHSPADVGLAVTGVLGPDADEDGNPVGLVFFAAGPRGCAAQVERHEYGHQPHEILRRRVVIDALSLLDRAIETPEAGIRL
jgi:nicotinamide-nucleotide amidase